MVIKMRKDEVYFQVDTRVKLSRGKIIWAPVFASLVGKEAIAVARYIEDSKVPFRVRLFDYSGKNVLINMRDHKFHINEGEDLRKFKYKIDRFYRNFQDENGQLV